VLSLKGSFVALVTPFTSDDEVDHNVLGEMVEWHISQGTSGVVPCGTTGESPTLSHQEHESVVETVVKAAAGKIKVIAGTGSNSTREAIKLTEHAKDVGVDGALVVMPYYNKPSPPGQISHYCRLAEIGLPIVIYNIPGRTSVNMTPETMGELAKLDSIIGVKEATGSLLQTSATALACGEDFQIVSGDDALTLPIMSVGGVGVVSVIANIVPAMMAELCAAWLGADPAGALKIHRRMFGVAEALLGLETNPGPIKAAMSLLGWSVGQPRPPLSPLSEENTAKLTPLLEALDLNPMA